MLQITIPEKEFFDERKQCFVTQKSKTLRLEHSLISVSRWESKWHKSYLDSKDLTPEENADYIRCMCLDQETGLETILAIPISEQERIKAYVEDSMTATTITDLRKNKKQRKQRITSELIYSWMVEYGIPFECEKWHLSRLLMLIQVCGVNNSSGGKMTRKENAAFRKALNQSRKAKTGSKG